MILPLKLRLPLNGYYQYDDEGSQPLKVTVIQDGILKTF